MRAMIAIVRWELARRRTFIIMWCLGIAALIAMLMLIYPSIHSQAKQLNEIMQQLPASVRALRGGETDITSPAGFLNGEIFYITLPLLLIILAVNLGGSLLGKDEQDQTLELVLARPIGRGQVLLAKALAGLAVAVLVGIVSVIMTVLLARLVDMNIDARDILLASVCTTIFSFSFGAITFALSAASLFSRRLGVIVAVAASFGGYLLESLSSVSDYIKDPAKLLPYHYFVPRDMLTGHLDRSFVFYMVGIFVAGAILSYFGFRRRDIG